MEIPNNKFLTNECAICYEPFAVDHVTNAGDVVTEFGCKHVFCLACTAILFERRLPYERVKCPTCVQPVGFYKVGEYSVILDVTGPETIDLIEPINGDEVEEDGVTVVDLTLPDPRVTYEAGLN